VRRLDRTAKIFLVFYGLFMAGILVLVFCMGPTYEKVACGRPPGECVVTESYFFGLGPVRRHVFPLETLSGARVRKVLPGVGNRRRPPMILELVFKSGASYPTIDFCFRGWAQKEADAFNRFLADGSAETFAVDSTGPALAVIFSSAALFLGLFALGFYAKRFYRRRPGM
jgi:hypothetical protein